jgi:beta-mannosidase
VIIATALPAGNASVTVTLPAVNVDLWWPNGLGKQAMYTVSVSWVASAVGSTPITDSRRVGFRTLYLVTANDADPASLLSSEGSGNFTMRWRVNGANIYSFGGNGELCCCRCY